jgi:hypothetical protein
MAAKPSPGILVALAAGGYLLFTESGQELVSSLFPAARRPDPAPSRPPITVADPWSAAIMAAGGLAEQLLPGLDDPDSGIREGLRNLDRGKRRVQSKLTFGAVSDPKKKEKKARAAAAAVQYQLTSMERFAQRVHDAARRADVHEWVIDTPESGAKINPTGLSGQQHQRRPRITIYYKKKTGDGVIPHTIWVPKEALPWALAWIAEPIARATGGWTQRGHRLANGAPFVYYVDEDGNRVPCYSDTNPFAGGLGLPTNSNLEAIRNSPERQARRLSDLRRKLAPSARAALDRQVAADLNPEPQQ